MLRCVFCVQTHLCMVKPDSGAMKSVCSHYVSHVYWGSISVFRGFNDYYCHIIPVDSPEWQSWHGDPGAVAVEDCVRVPGDHRGEAPGDSSAITPHPQSLPEGGGQGRAETATFSWRIRVDHCFAQSEGKLFYRKLGGSVFVGSIETKGVSHWLHIMLLQNTCQIKSGFYVIAEERIQRWGAVCSETEEVSWAGLWCC